MGFLHRPVAAGVERTQSRRRSWSATGVGGQSKEHLVVVHHDRPCQIEPSGSTQSAVEIRRRVLIRRNVKRRGSRRATERGGPIDDADPERETCFGRIGHPRRDARTRLRPWASALNLRESAPEDVTEFRSRVERDGTTQSSDLPPDVSWLTRRRMCLSMTSGTGPSSPS
jgi:hypothetical protein